MRSGVASGPNLADTFDETVKKGSGNIVIKEHAGDAVVETIPVTDARVSISGAVVTINPDGNLAQSTMSRSPVERSRTSPTTTIAASLETRRGASPRARPTVHEVARVRLNGEDLGVVWCAPWQVDISDTVKEGTNTLEIEVANLWPNRLIGDAGKPESERLTWAIVGHPYQTDRKLLPSGLLGPVQILINGE